MRRCSEWLPFLQQTSDCHTRLFPSIQRLLVCFPHLLDGDSSCFENRISSKMAKKLTRAEAFFSCWSPFLCSWVSFLRGGSNIIHTPSRNPRAVPLWSAVHPSAPSSAEASVLEGLQTFKQGFSSTFTGQVGTPKPLQRILHLPPHLPQVYSQAPTWKHLSNYLWRSQISIWPSPRDTTHHGGLGLSFLWTPQSGLKN